MSEILIQSKITTPQLHDKIIHRERLTSLLNENKNKNLIIVFAPAGFGKTTLVLDYLSPTKNKHAWLSIPQRGIEDASTFFEYLIVSLKNIIKEFGNTTFDVMKMYTQNPKMSKELIYACTASLVNEFSEYFKDDIILVIDDLHYIKSDKSQKWLKEVLNEILDNIPSNLHLILVTRVMPDLTLTQFKAKRNILIIEESHLSFDEEETAALLDEVYKYKYEESDIKLLDENIRGWITGLHLLLQAYGEDFNKVKYEGELDKEIIYDFFAKEIFDNLSPELQEFMMVTSLMESFDEKLANAVLEIDNSKSLLTELIHRNLFIHEIHTIGKDNTISYSYHALFRDFLNRRLQGSRIVHEVKNLMEKIGDSYLNLGDNVSAINYFLEAGKYDKAVSLIVTNFTPAYNSGKYDKLWRWFNSLPEDTIDKNAQLLYNLSYLYLYTNTNYEKSLHYINKAVEQFMLNKDEDGLLQSSFVKTHIFEFTAKADEAVSEMEKLLNICRKPLNIIHIYSRLSSIYSLSYKFKEAESALERALKYCDDNKLDQSVKGKLNGAFALFYHKTSKYEKALVYFKKTLEDNLAHYNKIIINSNIAVTYNDMGDYSNSIKYSDIAFKLLEGSYSRELLVHLTSQKALLLQRLGDFKGSTKILQSVYPHVQKNNSLIYLWIYTDYLFMNYYLSCDFTNCLKYLNLNKSFAEALKDEYYKKMFQTHEAIYIMKCAPDNSVEEKLLDSYNYFDKVADGSKKTVLPWLSDYYLIINNPESALKCIDTYFKDSSFEANDLIGSRNLIDFALSRPELTQYKDKVHHAFAEFFNRLNIEGTPDEYKRKMKMEIEKLYDIKMTSFGALEFETRGNKIPEKSWRRKKGKSILAYMMLNPKGKYNKDKIIDMFFPEAKPETAENSFKQTVFSIRSVFKNPYLEFLKLEGNTLYLNPDCYFKSDAGEFDKLCNAARSHERNKQDRILACKDAIELYKGEFIEGNYEPWCEDLRSEYLNKFISISELLLDLLCKEKNFEDIIYYSEKLLKYDRLNEKAYLSLVEAYVRLEKKKSAKESYSRMLRIYNEELGEQPAQEILTQIASLIEN